MNPDSSRFEILRLLGEGGMGIVYEAFDRLRGERVALKTLRTTDARAIYRMKREFRALADVEHPNLVRLHDLFVDESSCHFTMELVDGVDLGRYVAAGVSADGMAATLDAAAWPLFDEGALRHALRGLLRGLGAIHGAGLLHRDLKPSNVLVTPRGRVVVLDFGLVADAYASIQQTEAGSVTGTVAYMAPEQARGESELTTACDLYAVGVVLFELLCGRLPYEGSPLQVLVAKQRDDVPSPRRFAPSVPEDLEALAVELMSFEPSRRPTLDAVLSRLDASSRPVQRTPRSYESEFPVRLHGREAELARLDALHRATADGRPSVALVRGRSGIGKSALLEEMARAVGRDPSATSLAGRCFASESVPFKGLDGIVDALSRTLELRTSEELGHLIPPDVADLAKIFPVLRRIRPIGAAYARRELAERPAQLVRARGFACLRELLRRLADAGPLLVAIDDVQWADEDSTRAVLDLLGGEHPPALTLLLGARPTDDSSLVRQLFEARSDGHFSGLRRETLDLDPLDDGAIADIARRGLDGAEDLVKVVVRDAEGSPFAAVELVRFLSDRDPDANGLDPHEPIDGIVSRRVARLDETSRRLLELISVAAEPTSTEVLSSALDAPGQERAAIDLLRTRSFIRSARGALRTSYEPSHDRIREAVANALLPEHAREIHRRLADALELVEPPPHDRLARHFAAAGEPRRARHYALAAAEDARAALALDRAAECLTLALDQSMGAERVALLPELGDSLSRAGRFSGAAEVHLEAARVVDANLARSQRVAAAEALLSAGRLDEGLDLFASIGNELGVRVPRSPVGAMWEFLKAEFLLLLRGRVFTRREPADVSPDRLERARVLGAIARAYTPLDPGRGAGIVSRYALAAFDAGVVGEHIIAQALRSCLYAVLGWRRGAAAIAARLEAIDDALTVDRRMLVVDVCQAVLAWCAGDMRAARVRGQQAVARSVTNDALAHWLRSFAHWGLGFSLIHELDLAAFERTRRFVEERELIDGPYAELRIRYFSLAVHGILLGETAGIRALSEGVGWEHVTSRELAFRAVGYVYSGIACFYEGDDDAAERWFVKCHDAYVAAGLARLDSGSMPLLFFRSAVAFHRRDEAALVAHARSIRRGSHPFRIATRRLLAAMLASLRESPARAAEALLDARAAFAAAGWEHLEVGMDLALATLGTGLTAESARERYLSRVEGSGIVDPDRYFWMTFPVGTPPPRRRSVESCLPRPPHEHDAGQPDDGATSLSP